MLDRSVPYYNILMKRNAGIPVQHYDLPEGYSFKMYEEGNEKDWAAIEVSVLEYIDEQAALNKFKKFMAITDETKRRVCFIVAPNNEIVGTASIWWEYSGQRRDPWVNYVAIKPQYQGKGLSKALISHILELSLIIEGDRNVYLHTQTWSHIAVRLYQSFNFEITEEPNLYKYKNDEYTQAREILKQCWAKYPKR